MISREDMLEYFRILGKFPYGITEEEDAFLDKIARQIE